MPIGTTSYFDRSIDVRIDSADRSDTSCSPERPPKITPTRSFFIAPALPRPPQRLVQYRFDRHRGESPFELFRCRPAPLRHSISRALEENRPKTNPIFSD